MSSIQENLMQQKKLQQMELQNPAGYVAGGYRPDYATDITRDHIKIRSDRGLGYSK